MEQWNDRYPQESVEEYLLDERELATNPSVRVPIILCIDCSFSMRQQARLKRVMEGVERFCDEMKKDMVARDSVELCIISFGGEQACIKCDFKSMERFQLPELEADGETPLADAVELALQNLNLRKQRYEENGNTFYRPWLILIGDGDESRSHRHLNRMAEVLKEESRNRRLNVLCIMVGEREKVEEGSLMKLSPDGKVQYLQDLKFGAFFAWLSRSIQKTSQSMAGEEIRYEPTGTWGQVIQRRQGEGT